MIKVYLLMLMKISILTNERNSIMNNEKAIFMDPYILLSWVNTKLRDESPNLDSLCYNYDLNVNEIKEKLNNIGYNYNIENNQFIAK